jgi:hypothetical protein
VCDSGEDGGGGGRARFAGAGQPWGAGADPAPLPTPRCVPISWLTPLIFHPKRGEKCLTMAKGYSYYVFHEL